MSSYKSLWRTPGFARVIATQLIARLPFGMMSLAIVMHVEHLYGSYAIAGFALGAETIGAAISGPLLARWMGPWGMRRVLLLASIGSASAMAALALIPMPSLAAILITFFVGLTSPPVQSAARSIYPSIADKKNLTRVFSLDATSQEILWVAGPLIATILAAQISTGFGVIFMSVIQVLGISLFCLNREVGAVKISKPSGKVGRILKNQIVLTNAILGLLLIGTFGGIEVGAVAIFDKAIAGVTIAALSVGSILGGLTLGPRAKTKWAMTKFLILTSFGMALVLVNPTNAVWVSLCFFIAGMGVAPALGVLASTLSAGLKPSETAEAYGWSGTGQLMGYSAGAALAGIAIDSVSAESSLFIALVFALATLAVAILSANLTTATGKAK